MARVPLYKAAETEMVRRIQSGEWPVGLRLPNEFGLADEFGVSQGTMRRALMTLESRGLLSRKPGRGTIVAAPPRKADAGTGAVPDFGRITDAQGSKAQFQVFRARSSTRSASATETDLFGTTRIAVVERTLKRAGSRAALDEVAIPENRVPAIPETAPSDLSDMVTALGLDMHRIDDRVSTAMTTMADSVALSVDRHTALLVITRVARNANGDALARQVLRIADKALGYDVTLGG